MGRAYALLNVKAFDAEARAFSGMATTMATDRVGDVIEPGGVKFANPLPLLLYHDSKKPVGEAMMQRATSDGVPFSATISTIDRPGIVKDRLDEAMDSLRANPPLIKGVSIGFRELEPPVYMKETGGYRFGSIEVYELSMVVIPANQEATIANLKSFDREPAALGTVPPIEKPAGVSAISRIVKMRSGTAMKKTYADQIATWEATRAAKAARQDEVQQKALGENRAKDDAEREEFEGLTREIDTIDKELVDLHTMDAREKQMAKPIQGTTLPQGTQSRTSIMIAEKELPPGIGFARLAMCVAMARGSMADAMALAKMHYPDDSRLEKALRVKTAVGAGAIVTSHWADDLVPYNILTNDFINYLRPGNIVDKFGNANPGGGGNYASLRRVPFNVRVSGFNAGTTGNWTGEGLPVLMSKATSFNTTLTWAKVAGLVALTKEEVRFSNPSAEAKVRDDIARAINTRIDIDFIDPAKAATANVSPASITSGIAATAPAGATAANLVTDVAKVLALFGAANLDVSDLTIIMSAQMAAQISMMTTTLGFPYFPGMSMTGGTLRGIPVLVSENLTAVGSPSTQTIVFCKASEIYLADDGNVTVDSSDQASLEMVDTSSQTGVAGTGASLVSLWQTGLIGILAQREITWALRRSTAVRYISPAVYAA